MAADGYLTIHRTTDVAQGELLAEMLRREGIDARFHKVSSTLIGMPASMIEMSVDVPAESEARARELIADLEYAGAAEALDQEAGARPDAGPKAEAEAEAPSGAAADAPSARRPIFAAAFAVFLPGGAHLYARRAWTGLVLACAGVSCLAVLVTTSSVLASGCAFGILAAIVACDAVGGVRAARADARGQRRPRGRQLAGGFALLGLAIVLGAGGWLATTAPQLMHTQELARYQIACTDRSIVVENGNRRAQRVEIANLKIVAVTLFGRENYPVGIKGSSHLDLGPNDRGAVTPDVADWLARACGFPSAPGAARIDIPGMETLQLPEPGSMGCGFWFSLSVGRDGAAADAVGFCAPPRSPGLTGVGKLEPLH